MVITLRDLADKIGASLNDQHAAGKLISGVATLDQAVDGQISFLYNRRYRNFLKVTAASAVIISAEDAPLCTVPALIMDNPYLGYARAATLLSPGVYPLAGVAATACVAHSAVINPSASVCEKVVIGERAQIGAHVIIRAGCVIEADVHIGDYSEIKANVILAEGVRVGRRCLIQPGAVIGADGFGFAKEGESWVKIPQLGAVHIGDDVEIGANSTIDRGALKDTVIHDGVKIDNQVQIGHNCVIGAHTAIAGCTAIAGSTTIGKRCMIGGAACIAGHITIADDVIITGMSGVHKSIRKAGVYSSGWPVQESKTWQRYVHNLGKLSRQNAYVNSHISDDEIRNEDE